jgi:hypothetical protein
LRKKSRSTVSWPIFSYSGASCAVRSRSTVSWPIVSYSGASCAVRPHVRPCRAGFASRLPPAWGGCNWAGLPRRWEMTDGRTDRGIVGLDVAKTKHAVAIAEEGRTGEVAHYSDCERSFCSIMNTQSGDHERLLAAA